MSRLVSQSLAFVVALAFVASLPRRHLSFDRLPSEAPSISPIKKRTHVDVWYKPSEIQALEDLPTYLPDDPNKDPENHDQLRPAWGMFTAMSALALYSVLDQGRAVQTIMFTVMDWFLPCVGVFGVFVYLVNYGLQYSLRMLFVAVTVVAACLGVIRLL